MKIHAEHNHGCLRLRLCISKVWRPQTTCAAHPKAAELGAVRLAAAALILAAMPVDLPCHAAQQQAGQDSLERELDSFVRAWLRTSRLRRLRSSAAPASNVLAPNHLPG